MSKKFISVMFIIILTVTSILGSGVFYVISSAGSGVSLSVNPEFLSAEPDHVFTVNISIANVENLLKWSLSVTWDPAVIELDPASASAVTEGDFLKNAGLTFFRVATYTVGSGCLSFISCELIQPTSVSGDGTLLILHFRAVNDGETDIVIGNSVLYNFNKQKILHTCSSGRISVKSVTHNVAVKLEAPSRLILGNSVLLNATVKNVGDADEENVNLAILINGTVETSQTIPLLKVGSSHGLSYLWTPSSRGVYNITAYADPLDGESQIHNNHESFNVIVLPNVHDVAVSLECPQHLVLNQTEMLNLTVTNLGAFDEFGVNVSIIVNGTVGQTWLIHSLNASSSWSSEYALTVAYEGVYNVTLYASPVQGELNTSNNVYSMWVHATNMSHADILVVSDDGGYYQKYGTSLKEFESALSSAGYDYEVWIESKNGTINDVNILKKYKIVIWTCGDYAGWVLNPREQKVLLDYFQQGGNILLEGAKVVSNMVSRGEFRFLEEVLYVNWVQYEVESAGVKPVFTHPITKNLNETNWITPLTAYPDGVVPFDKGFSVMQYIGTSLSAVTVVDSAETGSGSVVYYSFSLFSLPTDYRRTLVSNTIDWFRMFGVSDVVGKILYSPENTSIFIYGGSDNRTGSEFNIMAGSMLYSLCENEQLQGFAGNYNTSEVSVDSIALFGSPLHNKIVRQLNDSKALPVILYMNSDGYCVFKDKSGEPIAEFNMSDSTCRSIFVIQSFVKDGNAYLVIYSLDWKGMWAAGLYLSRTICRNLRYYYNTYYMFEWEDQNGDSLPQLDEILAITNVNSSNLIYHTLFLFTHSF